MELKTLFLTLRIARVFLAEVVKFNLLKKWTTDTTHQVVHYALMVLCGYLVWVVLQYADEHAKLVAQLNDANKQGDLLNRHLEYCKADKAPTAVNTAPSPPTVSPKADTPVPPSKPQVTPDKPAANKSRDINDLLRRIK